MKNKDVGGLMNRILKRRKVISALNSKGFETQDSDHDYFILIVNGEHTHIRTKISRGTSHRELSKNMISKIARDLSMRKEKFYRYVDCEFKYEDYVSDLRDRRLVG